MLRRITLCWSLLAMSACGSDGDGVERGEPLPLEAQPLEAQPLEGQPPEGQPLEGQPLEGQPLASFVDPDTGFSTRSVHDVDRQIIHFDSERMAMIWGADGAAVSGWTTSGNELRWNGGGGFQVRFGTEEGERRAYFTEAGPGTICDLDIRGPEQLSISPSRETPPQP